MGAHMDISSAPRVWVKNASGMGVRVVDPAWLVRQRRLHEYGQVLAKRAARPKPAHQIENERRAREAAMLAAAQEQQREQASLIISHIAKSHDLTAEEIKGKDRRMELSLPRYHAIYEVRRLCPDLLHKHIAEMFGHAHHKIVLRAVEEWPKRARLFGIPVKPLEGKS